MDYFYDSDNNSCKHCRVLLLEEIQTRLFNKIYLIILLTNQFYFVLSSSEILSWTMRPNLVVYHLQES